MSESKIVEIEVMRQKRDFLYSVLNSIGLLDGTLWLGSQHHQSSAFQSRKRSGEQLRVAELP